MPDTPMPGSLAAETARRRTLPYLPPRRQQTTLTERSCCFIRARFAPPVPSKPARATTRHQRLDGYRETARHFRDFPRPCSLSLTAIASPYSRYPSHQDFSEDTYRVLVAADSAVMLIDAAKGVEAQTIKLFKVCRLRNIDFHLRQQDGPRGVPVLPDGGDGAGARHSRLPDQLAHRHGRRLQGRFTTATHKWWSCLRVRRHGKTRVEAGCAANDPGSFRSCSVSACTNA